MNKAFLSLALMGLLTATGFLASAQQDEEQQKPQQQQQMSADDVFARLDADGDGKLSEAEFAAAHGNASAEEQQQAFGEWDANGDKSISKDEFASKYGPR